MFSQWAVARKQRKIASELMHLELAEQEALAKAEFMVITAERALADARLEAERAREDALMEKRWQTKRLEIIAAHLDKEDQAYAGTMEVVMTDNVIQPAAFQEALGKAVQNTFGGKEAEKLVSRQSPFADQFKKDK